MLRNIVIWIFLLKIVSVLTDTLDESVSLNFEDNIIDGKFSLFSKMNTRFSRQSNIELIPIRTISSLQYQKLIEETQLNPHLYYTLKVHFKRHTIQDYVMTSIPMCLILQSKFQFNLNLYLNENSYIVSLNILTNNSTCNLANISSSENLIYKIPLNLHFNDLGPQPDIQHFLDKLKREKEAKLSAQENDNRPFVVKYWKYLLPIVVIFVLQSAFTDGGGR